MIYTHIKGQRGRLGGWIAAELQSRGHELVGFESPDEQNPIRLNYLVFAHRYRGEPSYSRETEVNVHEVVRMIDAAHWAEGDRAIVIVSSISATEPSMNQSLAYNMSKAALNQLARDYGRRGRIRINTVSPNTFTGYDHKVTPQQVAKVIAFLCSPDASGISGADIRVTGGTA